MSPTMKGVRVGHETEVLAKAQQRFTAAEKRRALREADGFTKSGEMSALLRREGLDSSHLSTWREPRPASVRTPPAEEREQVLAADAEVRERRDQLQHLTIKAVRSSCDADLEHERPGFL